MTPQELESSLESIYDSISRTVNTVDQINDPEPEKLAELVNVAHLVKSVASDLLDALQMELVKYSGKNASVFDVSGGSVEIKSAYPRKSWQHNDLARAVSDRIYKKSIDMETGEMMLSFDDLVQEFMKYAAVSYWRVSELDKINIDANQYCETGDMKTSVIVRRDK